MHKESTVPNALRKEWRAHTGYDPLNQAKWNNVCIDFFLVSCSVIVSGIFSPTSGPFWFVGWSMIGLGMFGIIACPLWGAELDRRAGEFSAAMKTLCEGRIEMDFSPDTLFRLSVEKDLKPVVNQKLREIAQKIKALQAEGKETEANGIRGSEFKTLHTAMFNLGLADEKWDRYFQDEKKEGEEK